jgi:hypothetical protein
MNVLDFIQRQKKTHIESKFNIHSGYRYATIFL